MNYFGPSRANARAAVNAWTELTPAEKRKLDNDGCKRVVECMRRAGPILEEAAHRIHVSDWRDRLLDRAKIIATLFLLLLVVGGYALVYEVATAGSYTEAAKDIYAGVTGAGATTGVQGLNLPFPLVSTPVYPDPGPPSWIG